MERPQYKPLITAGIDPQSASKGRARAFLETFRCCSFWFFKEPPDAATLNVQVTFPSTNLVWSTFEASALQQPFENTHQLNTTVVNLDESWNRLVPREQVDKFRDAEINGRKHTVVNVDLSGSQTFSQGILLKLEKREMKWTKSITARTSRRLYIDFSSHEIACRVLGKYAGRLKALFGGT